MPSCFMTRASSRTLPIEAVPRQAYTRWLRRQTATVKNWLKHSGFQPAGGRHSLVPGRDGRPARVVLVLDAEPLWSWAALPAGLPEGSYRVDTELSSDEANKAALGWALASYRFGRYNKSDREFARLVWPTGCDRGEVERLADATNLVRDLVNTPASDMGPAELEQTARELAKRYGGRCNSIVGDKLLTQNYPMIHAVGRASTRAPRLIDLRWGRPGDPKVTLVGKGVCFDSGGLNIKPAEGMLLMKKDMGGAAHALGIAHAVMDAGLSLNLRVLVPAVENAIDGNAYRPLDVLSSRKGLSVEVGNTDAEGRLILADALAEADSEQPTLLLDFATLTGAARVALGTSLPALFSNHDGLAEELLAAGDDNTDPLWRLPLWDDYRDQLKSSVADTSSTGKGRFGGAITAALFLQQFVDPGTHWAHFDLMGYNPSPRPGRPEGADAVGLRAVYALLRSRHPA